MTNNTPSGTKKHRKSTEPESRQTAKMFFFLLLLIQMASSNLHHSFTMVFTQNSSIFHWAVHQPIAFFHVRSHTRRFEPLTEELWLVRYRQALRNGGYCGTAAVSQLFSNDECWHGDSTACTTQMFTCSTLRTTIVTFKDQLPDKLNYN